MRTSGAATESNMVVVVCLIVLGVAMVLAGGPRELLLALEAMLARTAEAVYQAWLSLSQ